MRKKYAAMLAVSGGLVAGTFACTTMLGSSLDDTFDGVASEMAEDDANTSFICQAEACEALCDAACEGFACCAAEGCEAACEGFACCAACGAADAAAECAAAAEEPSVPRTRGLPQPSPTFASINSPSAPVTAQLPPPPPEPAAERPPLDIPAYPTWPPEEASSRVDIGNLIPNRQGMTLFDAGQRLRAALDLADYSEHSFYSVPGGFILVTQREQIDTEGRTMPGVARFQQPGEGRDASMLMRIRDLFLERPPSFYRYLAIVITDRPFGASETALSAAQATTNVQQGSTALSRDARDIAFTDDFLAIALIYEYENPGIGTDLTMIEPGRIRPAEHLELSGLTDALPRAFAPTGAQ